jgi:hypothetical protein
MRERVTPELLGQMLDIRTHEERFKLDVKIQTCNGLDGFGIFEGFQWLRNHKAFNT